MTRPVVVLCGPMGSGKTSIGRRVASRLGVELRDTDHDVVAATGRSIPEIFADGGEAAFRDLEHEAVVCALREHGGVLALGGGAVVRPDTRDALARYRGEGGVVVFLDIDVRAAMMRIASDTNRPMLHAPGESARQRWVRIMAERREMYEDVASRVVATGRRTPGAVADEIVTLVRPPA